MINKQQLLERVRDGVDSRSRLVEEVLSLTIPLQIRALREAKGWTQQELADKLRTHQSRISELETPYAPLPSIATLRRIAHVFDVALLVNFESWPRFIEWASSFEATAPPSFDKDSC